MNHMEEVAHMLGLELNEKFRFTSVALGLFPYDLRFTKKKLEIYDLELKVWFDAAFETLCSLLNGEYEVVKLPKSILTEKEKKYLSDFIDPFKSQVTYIEKRYLKDFKGNEKEFISIGIKENEKYWRQMELPLYDAGKYYKGMNSSEHYTLVELGI